MELVVQNINYLILINQQRSDQGEMADVDNWQPKKTIEELRNLNLSLEDTNKFSEILTSFQIVGGKDGMETTRRILQKLLSYDLSLKLNWTGRNNKTSFSSFTNIVNLIFVAVRKNPAAKTCTQVEVQNVIKTWLRNAGDREGGRAKRRTN
ncbi:hypothetical protein FQR65_LT15059 [Abscondita terminalis]|nr:hypothetical protein FQR65_LT15059 [Abscondita terminalis]